MRPPLLASVRAGLIIAALAGLSGCSARPAVGAVQVQVELEGTLQSRCLKVVAEDDRATRETEPIMLAGRTTPVRVAVYADSLVPPVRVQAVGFEGADCATPTGEVSEKADAPFTDPPSTVVLTLRRAANPDAGTDAGTDDKDGGTDGGADAGTDGGFDAGLDLDNDGVPQPQDCDDMNPNVRPGATELCGNGLDDDCDQARDCADSACMNAACMNGGTCVDAGCMANTETGLCNDTLDNDNDMLIDCRDPDCGAGASCNDSNACTTGERCVSDGGCEKTGDVACTTPPGDPQCFASSGVGVCLPDAGTCAYTPVNGNCNDGLACTTGDTCAGGACSGTAVSCTSPPTTCFAAMGTCAEPSGACRYAPLDAGTGTCSDGDNCTLNDTCAGDGGCVGTAQVCTPPSQCHAWAGTCQPNGTCDFTVQNGQPCMVGNAPGTCNPGGTCVPNPTSLFPYVPSNFTEAQLPNDGGTNLTIGCQTTINTTGTPSITSTGCTVPMPPYTLITQSGGEPAMLIRVNNLTVNSNQQLLFQGTRPVIIAAVGDVVIDGTILARSGGNVSASCGGGGPGLDTGSGNGWAGGGGGAFGSAGAPGGNSGGGGAGDGGVPNGGPDLRPLRGGCRGGNGGPASGGGAGGNGGGGLQLSATGSVTIQGVVTAPGRGGDGATGTQGNSGGGGGSGGALLIEGVNITLNSNARLTANGGGGGEGSGGGTGDPGSDGFQLSGNAAPGGSGGSTNGGNGGDGASRGSPTAEAGFPGANNGDGGGGGGGGVGRIRINASSGCTVDGAAVMSPAPTSNGATGCP